MTRLIWLCLAAVSAVGLARCASGEYRAYHLRASDDHGMVLSCSMVGILHAVSCDPGRQIRLQFTGEIVPTPRDKP